MNNSTIAQKAKDLKEGQSEKLDKNLDVYLNEDRGSEIIRLEDVQDASTYHMPQKDTELLLISACIKNKKVLPILKKMIKPEMFSVEQYKIFFEVFLELQNEGKTINPLTVQNRLLRKGKLEFIGGADAIDDLCQPMVNQIFVRDLAKNLFGIYAMELSDGKTCSQMESLIYSNSDVDDKLYDIKKIIDRLSEANSNPKHARNMNELIDDTMEQAHQRIAKSKQAKE